MTETHFFELIDKYLSGEATEEENRVLSEAYEQFQQSDKWNETELGQEEDLKEILLSRIKESIHQVEQSTTVNLYQQRRYWWMVAASVLLILVAGTLYFTLFNNGENLQDQVMITNQPKNDILPGGNKATLTLADGSEIILDNADTGILARQGNVKVLKLENGKLEYQQSSQNSNAEIQFNTIATPRGGQYQLVLADGSKVWLNSLSSLKFPARFSERERVVEITGEAYFEVVHDPLRPFLVRTGKMEVKVLGTQFNIKAYKDEEAIKTTLIEGAVEINAEGKRTNLKSGEQAVLQLSSFELKTVKNVDLEQVVSWKNGYFSFQDMNLKDIMREIERWYNVEVIFDGNFEGRVFGGGIARNTQLPDVLKILKESNVNFELNGRQLTVKP